MSSGRDRSLERPGRFSRLLPPGNLTGSLYGLILVSSVMAVAYRGQKVELLGASLVVTAAVFALAHAWASSLDTAAQARQPIDRRAFVRSISHEWPMVTAAFPAGLAIALAAAGVYSVETGLWVASVTNVLLLFVWGAGVREVAGGGLAQVLLAGLLTAALGLGLVGLKVLVH